jgi:low affinity Fe/Cu permease
MFNFIADRTSHIKPPPYVFVVQYLTCNIWYLMGNGRGWELTWQIYHILNAGTYVPPELAICVKH